MDAVSGLRIMYGAAIVGAGVVGFITLVAPGLASRYVFAGGIHVDVYFKILGAVWMALGGVAILGVIYPQNFVPILMVQLVYKAVWLAVAAYPALIGGNRDDGLIFLTVLFTVWVIALLILVPFELALST